MTISKIIQPILAFKTQSAWEKWLSVHHNKSDGIWMRFYKKASGIQTIVYSEALDVALCYGWIDGQAKSYDEKSYLQKFTPHRKRSIWSKRNTEHVARLIKSGLMKPPGLKAVEEAKSDGRWAAAYESPKNMLPPQEFLKALSGNKKANEFFKTLSKTNTYAIAWQIHNAKKPETKERRIKKFISMLERGEKLY